MAHNDRDPIILHDGPLTIATGTSRKESKWRNQDILWSELVKRLKIPIRTAESYAEYVKLPKALKDNAKDVGGYVGGSLKGGQRKLDTVAWRQLITLDADYIQGDLWTWVTIMFDRACLMYTTHSHCPEQPRARLVIPLSRGVTPEEYQAVARKLASDFGIDNFDDSTYEPHRLMYWASASRDGEFKCEVQDERWLDPDEVLSGYQDWTDSTLWAESSRAQGVKKKLADKQGNPCAKPGMIGAFNRIYPISEAIETFLSDVYKVETADRYTYIDGSTSGGLVIYDEDRFAYSHHGTDPICGHLVNAFDLVRIHKFGAQDDDAKADTPMTRLPSYKAMLAFAGQDDGVKEELGKARMRQVQADFGGDDKDYKWLSKLTRHHSTGKILSTRDNALLVLVHDDNLKDKIAYNAFACRPTILAELPWAHAKAGDRWQDEDESALAHYLETLYGIDASAKVRDAFNVLLKRHRYHPVRDYLDHLVWDGEERLDQLLIDYLGAEDCDYIRAITRKTLTGAVKRVYEPGCKMDYMLTLIGAQGIGKSYLLHQLGRGWFSDSLSSVQGKEAYEQLQGVWIVEMSELTATKKAEDEAIKQFLTKQEDIFRVAYGRQVSAFPRQCIFIGTTNDRAFLKDQTGGRRFWVAEVSDKGSKSLWHDLTPQVVDQIWAEAKMRYTNKEPLMLSRELEQEAKQRQAYHTEDNPLVGIIQEYLDKPLPRDWVDRDIGQRRLYLSGDFGDGDGNDLVPRDKVCALEVWVELLGGDVKSLKPIDSRRIRDAIQQIEGWEMAKEKLRFGKIYGRQRAFIPLSRCHQNLK